MDTGTCRFIGRWCVWTTYEREVLNSNLKWLKVYIRVARSLAGSLARLADVREEDCALAGLVRFGGWGAAHECRWQWRGGKHADCEWKTVL